MTKSKHTFLKFFLTTFFLIIILASGIAFFSSKTLKTFYYQQLTNDMQKLALTLSDIFLPYMETPNPQQIDKLAKKYGRQLNIRITVIGPDGSVWGNSQREPRNNRPGIGMTIKVTKNSKLLGFVRISCSAKGINHLLGKLKSKLLDITLLVIAIGGFIAFFFSRSFSQPLNLILKTLSEISRGNFKARIHLDRQDEWGKLARHINAMAQRLEELFYENLMEKEELKILIERLKAGLLVIDLEGRILRFNEAIKEIPSMQIRSEFLKEGSFYWEAFRSPELNTFLKELRSHPDNYLKEIPIGNKTFLCSTSYLPRKRQLIIIFHDISAFKEIQRVKRDLVSNVSHELKTPLTAIQGFVETLLSMENDRTKRHYLQIIERHTKRLTNIVKDLLILSDLENQRHIELQKVNLDHLLNNLKELFEPKMKEKGLELKIEIDPQAQEVFGDEFKLEQMFFNLWDNALKYTSKGGIHIKVEPYNQDKVKISIADTGIGIPKEHLPYLFERFYVVDKSRSRKSGGTGLGLSIVKHIVELHQGEIKVKSQPGQGTCFIVILPKRPITA